VFFTIDAGPQVKAVCLPESLDTVAEELAAIPGVLATHTVGLGEGARLLDP
jgi:diphosphomevalonate decarboxylase